MLKPSLLKNAPDNQSWYPFSIFLLVLIWGIYTLGLLSTQTTLFPESEELLFVAFLISLGLSFRFPEAIAASAVCHTTLTVRLLASPFLPLTGWHYWLLSGPLSAPVLVLHLGGTFLSLSAWYHSRSLERSGVDPQTLQRFAFPDREAVTFPPDQGDSSEQDMICPMCGAVLNEQATMCAECGETIHHDTEFPSPGNAIAPLTVTVRRMRRNLILQIVIWGLIFWKLFPLASLAMDLGLVESMFLVVLIPTFVGLCWRSEVAVWGSGLLQTLIVGTFILQYGPGSLMHVALFDLLILSLHVAAWWVAVKGVFRTVIMSRAGCSLQEMKDFLASPHPPAS